MTPAAYPTTTSSSGTLAPAGHCGAHPHRPFRTRFSTRSATRPNTIHPRPTSPPDQCHRTPPCAAFAERSVQAKDAMRQDGRLA
jgi:hypothetical protein